jgi:hypothetical protein
LGEVVTEEQDKVEVEVEVERIDQLMMARCIEHSKIGAAAGELP